MASLYASYQRDEHLVLDRSCTFASGPARARWPPLRRARWAPAPGRAACPASSRSSAVEVLDAQAQVTELQGWPCPGCQGQARARGSCSRPRRRRSAKLASAPDAGGRGGRDTRHPCARLLPGPSTMRLLPGAALAVAVQHGVAPVLDRRGRRAVAAGTGAVLDGVDQARQRLGQRPRARLRLGRQVPSSAAGAMDRKRASAVGCHARLYTTAPAFGSFGSSFAWPALTRSSRLTPSHIAMAAATKTDE